MNIKKYTANTMPEALSAAKKDYGDDFLIISKSEQSGVIELVIALDNADVTTTDNFLERKTYINDYQASPKVNYEEKYQEIGQNLRERNPELYIDDLEEKDDSKFVVSQEMWEAIQEKIMSVDDSINSLSKNMNAKVDQISSGINGVLFEKSLMSNPLRLKISKKLFSLGVVPELSQQLTASISSNERDAWQLVFSRIKASISCDSSTFDTNRINILIGPPGVGKTTTIAKLASRDAKKGLNVGIISTDSYRIGAHDQMQTYGRLLGLDVFVAKSIEDFNEIIRLHPEKRFYVDTSGMSFNNLKLSKQLNNFENCIEEYSMHLVLPAATGINQLEKIINAFGHRTILSIVVSKMDEATGIGEFVSFLSSVSLPLSFLTTGQEVPSDLKVARKEDVLNSLYKGAGLGYDFEKMMILRGEE